MVAIFVTAQSIAICSITMQHLINVRKFTSRNCFDSNCAQTRFEIIFFLFVFYYNKHSNFRVTFRYNLKADTKQGRIQLISLYFRTRALLADLAQTNVKPALDYDKSTKFSCIVQLSDQRYVMTSISFAAHWGTTVHDQSQMLSHTHQNTHTCAWVSGLVALLYLWVD